MGIGGGGCDNENPHVRVTSRSRHSRHLKNDIEYACIKTKTGDSGLGFLFPMFYKQHEMRAHPL